MMARGRLAVLSAHLSAESSQATPQLETSCVSAQSRVPPPDNLKGLLTIVDERSGQRYKVQVSADGTVKATDLKKVRTLIKLTLFRSIRIIFFSVVYMDWSCCLEGLLVSRKTFRCFNPKYWQKQETEVKLTKKMKYFPLQ